MTFFLTGHMDEIIIPSKEGLLTDTVCLKWCTPKSSTIGQSLLIAVEPQYFYETYEY